MSHIGLLAVGFNWPRIRYVVRSGLNGADLALLDVLGENIAARFDQVVIASGDGIFSDIVSALTGAGIGTTVLARPGTLARSLQSVASQVFYLPEPPSVPDTTPLTRVVVVPSPHEVDSRAESSRRARTWDDTDPETDYPAARGSRHLSCASTAKTKPWLRVARHMSVSAAR
jgi:hypothetical protein